MKTIKKTSLSLLFVLAVVLSAMAQDVVEIHHKYYTSYFSKSEHIPLVVTYTLTKSMLSCSNVTKRTNKFKPDPEQKELTNLLKDYRNSGYDRGHNMNAADNKCDSIGMTECFYFSNMTPQPHSFNAGRWEELENLERTDVTQFNKIIVTCGSIGIRDHIGVDNVAVPKFMWKVIYVPTTQKYLCYLFPNTDEVTSELSKYAVKLNQIENMASVSFSNGIVDFEKE